MLKLYQERESNEASPLCRAVCSVSVGVNDDVGFREPKLSNSEILQNLQRKLSHLKTEEQNDMKKLLLEFHHLFPDVPSRTTCVYHDVDVESAHPCKQHPYRVSWNTFKRKSSTCWRIISSSQVRVSGAAPAY